MTPYHTHNLCDPLGYYMQCNFFVSLHRNLRHKLMTNLVPVRDRKALALFKNDLFNWTRRDLLGPPVATLEDL